MREVFNMTSDQRERTERKNPGYLYTRSYAEPRDQWTGKYFSEDHENLYVCLEPGIVHLFKRSSSETQKEKVANEITYTVDHNNDLLIKLPFSTAHFAFNHLMGWCEHSSEKPTCGVVDGKAFMMEMARIMVEYQVTEDGGTMLTNGLDRVFENIFCDNHHSIEQCSKCVSG